MHSFYCSVVANIENILLDIADTRTRLQRRIAKMPMLVQPLSARQANINTHGNKYPQSQCDATSGGIRKAGGLGDNNFDVQNINAALQKMTFSDDKENVRPSSGKKWRQKLDQNRRRTSAGGDTEGRVGNVLAEVGVGASNINISSCKDNITISKGQQQTITAEKWKGGNKKKNGKKKPQLKSSTASVVEDNIPLQHHGKGRVSMQNIPILPSSDSPASSKWSSTSPSSSKKSGGSAGRSKKNQKKSKAKKNDVGTNAGGRSVLALLGQYPAMQITSAEGYDGSSPPPTSVQMMPSLTHGVYQAQYDPFNHPTDNAIPTYAIHQPAYGVQPYPIYTMTTSDVHHSGTVMMPAHNGYYVPITTHGGTLYYNCHPSTDMHQIDTTTCADASYYHAHYDPYDGTLHQAVAPYSAAHYHESSTSKKSLNVNAPVFNPKTSYPNA